MKLCLPLLACALFLQDPKVELRWKWQKGQELVYKSIKKSVMDLGPAPLIQEEGNRLSLIVTDVSESGEAAVTMKYLAVSIRGSGPLGDYDYDSDKDKVSPADGPGLLYARLVGQSFTFRISSTGGISDVQGFDRILDALLKGAGEEAAGARAQLKPMFSNEAFKATMQQLTPAFPEERVGKGDSWTREFVTRMPVIGDLKLSLTSTLTGVEEQNALIDQEIKIAIKDNGTVELKEGRGKATSVCSIEKGGYLSRKSTVELTLVSAVDGQAMPIKTVSELTLVSRK
jgi:hypothetical protein